MNCKKFNLTIFKVVVMILIFLFIGDTGLSSGAIAAIVVVVLLAFVAAIGAFVLWRTHQAGVWKFLRFKNTETTEA